MQDFLGGDITMDAGDDLTADSLLEDVAGAYYQGDKAGSEVHHEKPEEDSLGISSDLVH